MVPFCCCFGWLNIFCLGLAVTQVLAQGVEQKYIGGVERTLRRLGGIELLEDFLNSTEVSSLRMELENTLSHIWRREGDFMEAFIQVHKESQRNSLPTMFQAALGRAAEWTAIPLHDSDEGVQVQRRNVADDDDWDGETDSSHGNFLSGSMHLDTNRQPWRCSTVLLYLHDSPAGTVFPCLERGLDGLELSGDPHSHRDRLELCQRVLKQLRRKKPSLKSMSFYDEALLYFDNTLMPDSADTRKLHAIADGACNQTRRAYYGEASEIDATSELSGLAVSGRGGRAVMYHHRKECGDLTSASVAGSIHMRCRSMDHEPRYAMQFFRKAPKDWQKATRDAGVRTATMVPEFFQEVKSQIDERRTLEAEGKDFKAWVKEAQESRKRMEKQVGHLGDPKGQGIVQRLINAHGAAVTLVDFQNKLDGNPSDANSLEALNVLPDLMKNIGDLAQNQGIGNLGQSHEALSGLSDMLQNLGNLGEGQDSFDLDSMEGSSSLPDMMKNLGNLGEGQDGFEDLGSMEDLMKMMGQSQTNQGAMPSSTLMPQDGFSLPTGGSKKQKKVNKQKKKHVKKQGTRQELIKQVFDLCDADQDILLNQQEMERFAKENGFDGDEDTWATEYKTVCAEYGKDPDHGMDVMSFTKFVEDKSEKGFYLENEELRELVKVLIPQQPARAVEASQVGESYDEL